MELSANGTHFDASWSIATTWTVAGGSLRSSVTIESSLSTNVDDTDNNHDGSSAAVDSTSKSPLVLCSSSPDPAPCEITKVVPYSPARGLHSSEEQTPLSLALVTSTPYHLDHMIVTFAQKHEVRQVYIRSTARVYEIYCASEKHSGNEYLCTVRCGIAARGGEVLCAPDIDETVLTHLRGFTEEISEGKHQSGSKVTANEDDWVEVKVPNTSLAVNSNSYLTSNSVGNPGKVLQVLYEATAEMTDASPCTSLTLRLLSLQNKHCAFVDEVYVFADPVDLDDQVGPLENSAGSSLMAMLVPSLLQFSKDARQGQDGKEFDTGGKQMSEDVGSKTNDTIDVGSLLQQERKSSKADHLESDLQGAARLPTNPIQLEIPPEFANAKGKLDTSCSHIEIVLDQLMSRVNRIEDLFLRFEERMLKPISTIDERLQHVEKQLELLTKRTQNSMLHSTTRICAPEFSCGESETNSHDSGSMYASYVAFEAKESPPSLSLVPPDPMSAVVSAELHPSLLVTAPEFSNCDDEEENRAAEPVKDSSKIERKDAITIDNALASAFSGFLSSISIESEKHSQTLAIRAPEFASEEEKSSTCFRQADETEGVRSSSPYLSNKSSSDGEKNVLGSLDDGSSVKKGEGVDEQKQHMDGEESCSQGNFNNEPLQHDLKRNGAYQMTEDIRDEEACNWMSGTSVIEKADGLEELAVNQTNEGHDITPESAILHEVMASTEVTKERSDQDALQNLSQFSCAACPVDFETQILDVKFISEENLNPKSPLEALLAGTPDLIVEVPSIEETGHDISQIGVGQGNLISLEDWGATVSTNEGHIPVDMDYCNVTDVPFKVEGDKLQGYHSCGAQEMPAASLI